MAEPSAPPALLELPRELLVAVLAHAGDNDYAMLVLPLVCTAFRDACVSDTVAAFRLASRLRQVVDVLPANRPTSASMAWLIGHTWSAILEATKFFQGKDSERRLLAFHATPGAEDSLLKL